MFNEFDVHPKEWDESGGSHYKIMTIKRRFKMIHNSNDNTYIRTYIRI